MSTSNKVSPIHLDRQAVVYVRQSSPQQVLNHQESQKRQYALKGRIVSLGWRESQCLVIDEDLGISGARSDNRPGYQRLVSMLALREVGIIMGIEVSRLARNCLDWYQLLELASAFGTLIGDEDAIYDPSDFNDRLLLGLKGTISEVELYQIKSRMRRGLLNKAKRGDLEITLPIGYERDNDGVTRKTADQAVRTAIEGIFTLFRQVRTMRAVLMELRRRGSELPYWENTPGLGRHISWRRPTYEAIYCIMKLPTYAGVYVYGRRKSEYDPVRKVRKKRVVPLTEREVVIVDHHEGYITKDEYEENLKMIRANSLATTASPGAPREGVALLQGIVYCKSCGRKMVPRYCGKKHYYYCGAEYARRGDPPCAWVGARRVDAAVEEVLIKVINEGTVDLSFQILRRHKEEWIALKKQWDQKISRLEYESNLARRRYESVDPENRLVASTLELEWNQKLAALNTAQSEQQMRFGPVKDGSLPVEEVKRILKSFPQIWTSKNISVQEKKEIIRSVIERIYLKPLRKTIGIEIVWQGESVTSLEIPRYAFAGTKIYYRVLELAKKHTDAEIAVILNQEGTKTGKGLPWISTRVTVFRNCVGIPSAFTFSKKSSRIANAEYISSKELATRMGVKSHAIQTWCELGIVEARPRYSSQEAFWIKNDEELWRRLDFTTPVPPTAISIRQFRKNTKKSVKEVIHDAKRKGYLLVRKRRGTTAQFYVYPKYATDANNDRSM